MEAAAVAMLRGWGDPLRYLRLDEFELQVANAVVSKAQELHTEELKRFAEAVGALTGNRVGEILARAFK